MFKALEPDYSFVSLLEITPAWLKRRGYNGIILDVDNTYMRRDRAVAPDLHREWLQKILFAGQQVVFVSNNGGSRLQDLETATGLPVVNWAAKPFPLAFWRACNYLQLPKEQVLVLGDQLFTDVLGAHLYDLDVALVKPLDGSEFIVTSWMRCLERLVMEHQTDKMTSTGCVTKKEDPICKDR